PRALTGSGACRPGKLVRARRAPDQHRRKSEGALRLLARAPEGALRLLARAPEGALRPLRVIHANTVTTAIPKRSFTFRRARSSAEDGKLHLHRAQRALHELAYPGGSRRGEGCPQVRFGEGLAQKHHAQ